MGNFLKSVNSKILVISVSVIFATFLVAYLGFIICKKYIPFTLNIWDNWDTVRYLYIAHYGYCNSNCIYADERFSIVFFPLYPFLIRIFQFFVRNYMLSALIISNVSYTLAMYFLYKLVRKDFSHAVSLKTILLLSVFPAAYFLHMGYTESLFLFLVVSSFYCAVNKKWFLASLLGMLASLVRINGVVLFPALLVEYLIGKRRISEARTNINIKKDIFAMALIPCGSLIYLFINYIYFHNPFQFMIFQKERWFETFALPTVGFMQALNSIYWTPSNYWLRWSLPQIFFAIFAALIILFSIKKIRLSYSVYSILSLIIITCCSFWVSIPRFVVVIFPIFIVLAAQTRKLYFYSIIILSLIFQIFFLNLFMTGAWTF